MPAQVVAAAEPADAAGAPGPRGAAPDAAADRVGGARLGHRQSDVDAGRAGARGRLRRGPVVHHHLPDRRRGGPAAHRRAAAQGAFGAAQQDSLGVDRRAAAAPAAGVDRAAGRAPGRRPRGTRSSRSTRCGPTRCPGCARCCWPIRLRPAEQDGADAGPGAGALAAVVAAVQPAELHRAGDDPGRLGVVYQTGAVAALQDSGWPGRAGRRRTVRRGRERARRPVPCWSRRWCCRCCGRW